MPQDDQGRYYESQGSRSAQQVASAARTTTADGTAFDTANVDEITGTLAITAASGTSPTLDVILQTTADGTNFYTVGSFAQKTAAATEAKVFTGLGSLSRWRWTIAGTTPSFTFSIAATFEKD